MHPHDFIMAKLLDGRIAKSTFNRHIDPRLSHVNRINVFSSPDRNVEFLLHLLNESRYFIGRLERTDDNDFSKTGNFDASLRVRRKSLSLGVVSQVNSRQMFSGDVRR